MSPKSHYVFAFVLAAAALASASAGCELIAAVDRSKIPDAGSGGASTGTGPSTSSTGTGGGTCTDPVTDCPDPGTTCKTALCAMGACSSTDAVTGTKCSDGGGAVCDGSGKCVACNGPTDCPASTTLCATVTCAAGACGTSNATIGTMCSDGGGMACDGAGKCVMCNGPADCPMPTTVCVIRACNAGACGTSDASATTVCSDSSGRICSGAGACVACDADMDCPTFPTDVCQTHLCVSASCTDMKKDGTETDVDCGGGCAPCANALHCLVAGDCTSGFCNALTCAPCAADANCGGTQFCDAATSVCKSKLGNGTACGGTDQCTSGNCVDGVCCDTACTGTCLSCNQATSNGTCKDVPSGLQDPGTCSGAGTTCNGAGACVESNGGACAMAGQCLSGNCVDGVCCASACAGTCKACNVAGNVGTCANVIAGQTDPVTCAGANQVCNGMGVCLETNGGACTMSGQCVSGNCVDGVCCNTACAGGCNACSVAKGAAANGTCGPVAVDTDPKAACAPYTCDGAGNCQLTCNMDTDCEAGNYCSGNSCLPQTGLGTGCATSNQCTSSHCVDGECCSTTCTGTCQACNVAGSLGTCTDVPSGQPDVGTCSGSSVCNGAGACLLKDGVGCTMGATCLSGDCVDTVCCNTTCTGTCQACNVAGSLGTCSDVPEGAQDPVTCAGAALACDGAGHCLASPGTACGVDNSACASGNCVDGVCCTTACAGVCQTCDAAGSAGSCINIAEGLTDANPLCGGNNACNGAGACLAASGQPCTLGTQCASGVCTGGTTCM